MPEETVQGTESEETLYKERIQLTWNGVTRLLQDFVASLDRISSNTDHYNKIVAVSRGGLCIAGILSQIMDIRRVGVVSVVSYDDEQRLAHVQLNSTADPNEYNSQRTLIVDDVADTGRTMQILSLVYPEATRYALIAKPRGKAHIHACSEMVEQSVWVDYPWDIKRGAPIPFLAESSESSQ